MPLDAAKAQEKHLMERGIIGNQPISFDIGSNQQMATSEETLTTEGTEVRYERDGVAETLPARRPLTVPTRRNPKLARMLQEVNGDERLMQLWRSANVNAVDRSGMSDHGPVHIQIVANLALKLCRLLHAADMTFSVTTNYGLDYEDAEIIVLLGVALHDIGMSVHRHEHELYSFVLERRSPAISCLSSTKSQT